MSEVTLELDLYHVLRVGSSSRQTVRLLKQTVEDVVDAEEVNQIIASFQVNAAKRAILPFEWNHFEFGVDGETPAEDSILQCRQRFKNLPCLLSPHFLKYETKTCHTALTFRRIQFKVPVIVELYLWAF